MSKIIVFAFPVFLAAMALEIWWGRRKRTVGGQERSTYAFSDTLNSLSLGLLSQVVDTVLFISISFYGEREIMGLMGGQLTAKIVLSVVLQTVIERRIRRQSLTGR